LIRHFTREAFRQLFEGPPEGAPVAARAIRHAARCRLCWVAAVESVQALGDAPFPPSDLRAALVDFVRGTVREQTEDLRARAWWADLRHRSPEGQLKRIRSVAALQTLAVFEVLLAEARKAGLSDPYLGEATARVALALVDLLTEPPRLKSDLRAEALIVVANCRRIAADWGGAGRTLDEARGHRAQGTGEPGLEGRLLSIEGSYCTNVGRLEEGLALVRQAVEIFRRLEDGHGEAHNTVKEAGCLMNAGRPAEAVEKARLALTRLPPHEIRLQVLARLTIVDCLVILGKPPEALDEFDLGKPVFDQTQDLGTRLHVAYSEALLLDGLGRNQDSERLFRDTVKGCFEHELYKDGFATLITLFGSLCRRGALRKAADLCEEAIAAVAQSGEACDEEVLHIWEELLAVVKVRQPTDEELDKARNHLLYKWGVPKGGTFALPRLEAAVSRAAATPEPPPPPPPPAATAGAPTFRTARDGYERTLIADALEKTGGNISEAGRILGMSRPTVRKKKRFYGL